MKRKSETKLQREKRESRLELWLSETKAAMQVWLWTKQFQNKFLK
jgi:cytidylate kinase